MAETVTIEKEIEITIYKLSCECGEDVKYQVDLDHDGDLLIELEPHICIQKEIE